MNDWTIYRFVLKVDGRIYYGVTNRLEKRIATHFSGKSGANYFNCVMKAHSDPDEWEVTVIETGLSRDEAYRAERIMTRVAEANGKRLGEELLNLRHGGSGNGYAHSEEAKKKISRTMTGRPTNNRTCSPEAAKKISQKLKGRKWTKPMSEEGRKNIGAAGKGRIQSEETKAKRRASFAALTPEAREARAQKLSEVGKRRWAKFRAERASAASLEEASAPEAVQVEEQAS